MTSDTAIKVFIAEDHQLTQLGLKFVLEREPNIEVVGEEADGGETVRKVLELRPDVVLMDIGLPGLDGIQATLQIKASNSNTRVVMLTSYDNETSIFSAFAAGADAYCLKTISKDSLIDAIRSVFNGGVVLDPAIANRVLRATSEQKDGKDSDSGGSPQSFMTPRELEVLQCVVKGLSNKEISKQLTVSVETVKTHLRHVMEKMAVSDRTQAAVKAMRDGLV